MSVIPKIRFKGFTDDWEQRKFFELYEKNVEKNTEFIGYDKTISIATMTYRNEGNGASDESLKTYKVLRVGDLAFEGHTNKEFRYGRFVTNDIGIGIMSPRFSTLRPIKDMPVSFWKWYIDPEEVKYEVFHFKEGKLENETNFKKKADYTCYKESSEKPIPKFKFYNVLIEDFKTELMNKISPLLN